MANTLLLPTVIGNQVLANLYATNIMAGLVHRNYSREFKSGTGDTVTIKKPPMFTAQEFNRPDGIQLQDATETGVDVKLNHIADVSFEVRSEEWTMTITDFNEQFLEPAAEAIAQKIDADLLTLRNDITNNVGQTTGELWSNPRSMLAAGRVLTQNKVPLSQRSAVVGPVTSTEWLKDDLLNRADARGDTDGRREASLGSRLFHMDPYETNHIEVPAQTTGNSTTEVGVAFHKTAFALVTRPLALPMGAAYKAHVEYKGFSLRIVSAYDVNKKADVISIDTLYGIKTIDANRAVLIRGALV